MNFSKIFKILLLLSVAFMQSIVLAYAQPDTATNTTQRVSESEKFIIRYKLSSTTVEENTLDNEENLARISNYLKNSPRIDSITIYSYASPEGSYLFNKKLSEGRGRSAKEYLLSQIPADRNFDPDKIIIDPTPENWVGLRELVEERYFRYDREKLLRILDDNSVGTETKKWRIQQLNEGYTWKIILRDYMPLLRYSTWICVWVEVIDPLPRIEAVKDVLTVAENPLPKPQIVIKEERKTTFALKTNLLYDIVTAVNAGVEIPFGEEWSLEVEDVFPWWTWGPNKNKYAFRLWEIGIEPRWWFKRTDERDVLNGHYAGPYIKSGRYDFQNDKAICYQGEFWSAGLSYGFSMPLGDVLNVEFSVSVGYLSAAYRHYWPSVDYGELIADLYNTGRVGYFGPTEAKISLVLPIDFRFTKKGGRR